MLNTIIAILTFFLQFGRKIAQFFTRLWRHCRQQDALDEAYRRINELEIQNLNLKQQDTKLIEQNTKLKDRPFKGWLHR